MRKGWLVAVGLGALAVAAASWWLTGYGMFGPHGMMGGGGMMGYGRPGAGWDWALGVALGWLGVLAFSAAVLAGAALAVRALAAPGAEDPLAVARRRYAAGEIDRETFERLRDDLRR
jgi:putative membrane protein